MALADEVVARYGDQYLVNLTNPNHTGGTVIDAARLAKAAVDTEADFRTYAQVEFDLAEPQHVSLACDGVVVKLLVRSGAEPIEAERKWRNEDLKEGLALVTSRDRILPQTDSVLTPSSEAKGDSPHRSDFDRERWNMVIPGAPATGDDEERL